jgi:hypothetical protein
MPGKKRPADDEDKEFNRRWDAMNNEQRADYLLKQYEALTRNDNELAKQLNETDEHLAELKRDQDSLRAWADYERFVRSILDRDLIADAKAVKLFDNMKDPRDRSDEPEPPDRLKAQVALLWPFD